MRGELDLVIKSLKNRQVPGIDGIQAEVLKCERRGVRLYVPASQLYVRDGQDSGRL